MTEHHSTVLVVSKKHRFDCTRALCTIKIILTISQSIPTKNTITHSPPAEHLELLKITSKIQHIMYKSIYKEDNNGFPIA